MTDSIASDQRARTRTAISTPTYQLQAAFVVGALLVLTQRLAFPVGGGTIPLAAVAIPLLLLVWLSLRRVVLSPERSVVLLFTFALAAAIVLTTNTSLLSLLLIAALWMSVAICVTDAGTVQRKALEGVVSATALAGFLGLAQSVVSSATGVFIDPVALLPDPFRLAGYNTTDPIEYGGTWMKSNGMLFLEPSFLSLMTMFGVVALGCGAVGHTWTRKRKIVTLLALLIGFATAVAASGMVLVPALLAALISRGPRTFILSAIGASGALAILFVSPLGSFVSNRVFTFDLGVGSNSARLVRPYTELLATWAEGGNPFGYGAGAARDYTLGRFVSWQNEVTTPTLVKLVYEYGLLGIVALILIILLVLRGSRLPVAVRIAVLLALLIPTDGLTSSLLVGLAAVASVGNYEAHPKRRPARAVPTDNETMPEIGSTIVIHSQGHRRHL